MSSIDSSSIPDWIGAATNVVLAIAAIAAAWRYFTFFSVPLTAEISMQSSGKSYIDGKLVGDDHSWHLKLKNSGNVPAHIASASLQAKKLGFLWLNVRHGAIEAGPSLPASIPPNAEFAIWVSRGKRHNGRYRLMIREYGSMRAAAIPMIDVSRKVGD